MRRRIVRRLVLVLGSVVATSLGGCGSDSGGSDVPIVDGDPLADSAIGDGPTTDTAPSDGTVTDAPKSDAPVGDGGTSCGDPEEMLPAWFSATPEKEIYVSPSGDDANDGSAPTKALKTTAAALKKLAPGVRLDFAAGTYACASISNFDGTAAKPGWLRSSDGPRKAQFLCGGGGGLLLDKVHYLALDGLEVGNTTGHGVQLSSGGAGPWDPATISNELVIHGCYIHDTQLASFKGSQSKGVYVVGNELARAGAGRQNLEFVAIDDVVIAGNEAHHSGLFDEIKGGAINGIIYRNYVHDSTGGILVGGDCTGKVYLVNTTATWEAKNLRVWDNVIANDSDEAFRIVDCQDCVVANNTFYARAPKALIRMLTEGFDGGDGKCSAVKLGNKNVRVTNNVFLMKSPSIYGIATNETAGATVLSLDHNAWFATGGDILGVGSDVPFKGEATSLYVDPMLTSPPANLHPATGSPIVGKGAAVDFVKGNAEGKCWSPPDIGAY